MFCGGRGSGFDGGLALFENGKEKGREAHASLPLYP